MLEWCAIRTNILQIPYHVCTLFSVSIRGYAERLAVCPAFGAGVGGHFRT
jgi:hypothetical protein